uniref:AP2/ERF domain-containing protein n=1 Tax=Ananas comosus var. bracteatus TaxID=296719 RepID=A0A6V7NJ38_ANACO|nr:unnamed protein product [Ananas comosus var. bracteatus]
MELHFQQQQQHNNKQQQQQQQYYLGTAASNKPNNKLKGKSRSSNKFVGVRQRPSGRWVAEIKDTTQKIRMWLGTFETAEEAARAYDEAACLLRGSNTRTNFVAHPSSPNSPLASRIRSLLDHKKLKKSNTSPSNSTSITNTSIGTSSTAATNMFKHCCYKCSSRFCVRRSILGIRSRFDRLAVFDGYGELANLINPEVSEFERMRVERQISASLYAMNGVHEYFETVLDPCDLLWDLPPLCHLFCRS